MKYSNSKTFGAVVVFVSCFLPSSNLAWAGMVSSQQANEMSPRDKHLLSIQKVLQTAEVKKRLCKVGLSEEEIESRLAALSDSELASFAEELEKIQKGKVS
jgi:hypothetical protein